MIWRLMAILVVVFVGGVAGHWAADRNLPISVLEVKAVDPVVKPGEELRVQFTVERLRTDCEITVTRLLFDSQRARYVLMNREFPSAPGPVGRDAYIVPVPVPPGIALGPATYRSIAAYRCNIIHSIWPLVAPEVDVHFEVKP